MREDKIPELGFEFQGLGTPESGLQSLPAADHAIVASKHTLSGALEASNGPFEHSLVLPGSVANARFKLEAWI